MPKRNLIWLAAFAAVALTVAMLARVPARLVTERVPDFDPVAQTYRTIRQRYLYPLEDDVLRHRAVEGMVSRLDENSTYIPPACAEAFDDRMAGKAWGLGLKFEILPDGDVVVVGPLVNSPAQHCGLLRGDRVLKVDGNDVIGLPREVVESMLEGAGRGEVAIAARRGGGEPRFARCHRGKYPVETVQGLYRGMTGEWVSLLDANTGLAYLRIREVLPETPDAFRGALRRLDRLRTLILDLRGNPGGDLPAAVALAGMFLPKGRIATLVDRDGPMELLAGSDRGAIAPDVRVVALVDRTTASAAELLAGALAWQDRALLVGGRTRGKGCVQSIITLEGGLGRLNLTTAEFWIDPLRPIQRRKDSNAWGVDAHVELPVPAAMEKVLATLRVRAEVVQPPPGTMPVDTQPASTEDPGPRLLRLDPQLQKAVALAGAPAEMDAILRQAAVARSARREAPATLPATMPASEPAATARREPPGSEPRAAELPVAEPQTRP
jgi:carboxyl-terminal processing protease